VSFINEHGEEEAGIDGGGIFKISWRISLELLLMYSMVSSRYPLFFLKHAGEV